MKGNENKQDNNIIKINELVTVTQQKKRGRKKKIITTQIVQSEINNIMIEENINQNKVIKSTKKYNKSQIKKDDKIDNKTEINSNNDKLSNNKLDMNNNAVNINMKNNNEILENKNDTSDENNNNNFLKEMLINQLKNVNSNKKLSYSDIKRISKFLNISIFDQEKCSLWIGYITNEKNQSKGTYINFYFNKKKIALHRLLFLNYIGEISNEEYIKFSCENKGKCCNINHMKKYSYNKKTEESENNEKNEQPVKNDSKLHINTDKKKLIIEF